MDEVKAATEALQAARESVAAAERKRDEAVRRAVAAGVPVTEIAEAAGLSRMRVYQVRDGSR